MKTCLLLATLLGYVAPHGYLKEPPQRSSMWRYGFGTPTNVNDNGLNCGGFGRQFDTNKGKCGVCGDAWDDKEKENEAGGKYAKGIITKRYQSGSLIQVEVVITSNHKGFFEFRLCPHNNPSTPVTQKCLNQYLLKVKTGQRLVTKYHIGSETRTYKMSVRLPPGVTCTQCVLQWTYTAGNNWGCDESGCGQGKGKQEHFVNCADIAISPRETHHTTQTQPASTKATPRTTYASTTVRSTYSQATASPSQALTQNVDSRCRGVGVWAAYVGMDDWCKTNCAVGNCPPSHCACDSLQSQNRLKCLAVGPWSTSLSMETWCNNNCNHDPPFCPSSRCICF